MFRQPHTGTIGYPNFKEDNKNNNTRHICRNNVLYPILQKQLLISTQTRVHLSVYIYVDKNIQYAQVCILSRF